MVVTFVALAGADETNAASQTSSGSGSISATTNVTSSDSSLSGSVDGGDVDTNYNTGDDKKHKIKTAAHLTGTGAKIQLCPSGDCVNGQAIMLSMTRLQEFDDSNKPFVQEAKNFNALNATWTAFEPLTINGTDALSSSFATSFKVKDDQTDDTTFNLTAVIYQANGTAMNGNQTIEVPAGALKFSIMITNWPFKDTTNRLRFGVELEAQGKNKAQRDPGTKKPKGGKAKDMDRLDMGEGMFMDAPTLVVVDGVNVAINSSIEPQNKQLELVWVFPSFQDSLYYDPVMGSEDPSVSINTNGTSMSSSTTGSGSASESNSTITPTPSAVPTPTTTPSQTGTTTNTKASAATVLSAAVLGGVAAVFIGGAMLV